MLVYGDPQRSVRFEALVQGLQERNKRTRWQDPDSLRALLILAGQLEQAAFDFWRSADKAPLGVLANIKRATDLLASEFFQLWNGSGGCPEVLQEELRRGLCELASAARLPAPVFTVKIPEGFQFYALFPEQYFAAALDWAATHQNERPKDAFVVGIRSIGTTLSAAVKAALISQNWRVERTTVRPEGDPFNRHATVEATGFNSHPFALVVDEGPGLSGSSMAAVAHSLSKMGSVRVSFLPGHSNEPGGAASGQTRWWWANTPRYVVPLRRIRWNGQDLAAALLMATRDLSAEWSRAKDIEIEDVSCGSWRSRVYSSEVEWPPVCCGFERQKFAIRVRGVIKCLWRFEGLGSDPTGKLTSVESAHDRWGALAEKNLAPKPVGICRGFLAVEWVEGRRLNATDARNPTILPRLADYILQAAGQPLTTSQRTQGLRRLSDLLYWNTRETLGDAAAEQTRQLVATTPDDPIASYGDGRMAPWEWVQTSSGGILKTDCAGHDSDHTLIGRQPVLWDVAGTVVEWDLDNEATNQLLRELRRAGIQVSQVSLRFYSCAYAAFRAGMVTLALSQSSDPLEQRRLHLAREHYTRRLESFLQDRTTTA